MGLIAGPMMLWRYLSNKWARGAALWRVTRLVLVAELSRANRYFRKPGRSLSKNAEAQFAQAAEAMASSDIRWLEAYTAEHSDFVGGYDPLEGSPWFHVAVSLGTPEVVRWMLAAGADIEQLDLRGFSPLFHAILREDEHAVDVVHTLLKSGANTGVCNIYGETPVQLAASVGQTAIVDMLNELTCPQS